MMERAADFFIPAVRETVPEGGVFKFRARGSSMLPLISDGDTLTVLRIPARDARPGDVIVAASANRLTAHRLLRFSGAGENALLHTQGDAHIWEDEPSPAARFLGKVILAEDGAGKQLRLDTPAAEKAGRRIAAASGLKRDMLKTAGVFGPAAEKVILGRPGRFLTRILVSVLIEIEGVPGRK